MLQLPSCSTCVHAPKVFMLYCSPESQQGSPGDAAQAHDQEGGLAALAQLASPASSRPASRSRATARSQLADVESSSWDNREQRSSKFSGISADLDFEEFLHRQRRFLEVLHRHHGVQNPVHALAVSWRMCLLCVQRHVAVLSILWLKAPTRGVTA